jgi:hypothetical protein
MHKLCYIGQTIGRGFNFFVVGFRQMCYAVLMSLESARYQREEMRMCPVILKATPRMMELHIGL